MEKNSNCSASYREQFSQTFGALSPQNHQKKTKINFNFTKKNKNKF
jgi:hypothetical protein